MSKPLPFGEVGRRALRSNKSAYLMALKGLEPAEALPTVLRWRLVAELHRSGLTDVEVAGHTAMTTYTAARIREGMGLSPNLPREEKLSA